MRHMKPAACMVLFVTLLIAPACAPVATPSPVPTANPTAAPSPTAALPAATPTAPAVKPAAAPLTLEALKNAEYPSGFPAGKKVRLTDGQYAEAVQPGAASRLSISLHRLYALGDLNGDNAQDAAVILLSNGGGSGTFFDLAGVLNEDGTPRSVAVVSLGDRVIIESLSIKSGEITVEMVTQGPQDPLCCPTQRVTGTFKLQGDKLVQASSTPAAPATVTATGTR